MTDVFTPGERRRMRAERRWLGGDPLLGSTEADGARGHDRWDVALDLASAPLLALALWSRAWLGWWAVLPVALAVALPFLNRRPRRPPVRPDAWTFRSAVGPPLLLRRWAAIPAPARAEAAALWSLKLVLHLAVLVGAWAFALWPVVLCAAAEVVVGLRLRDRMARLVADPPRGRAA